MLCQNCNKNIATTHFSSAINGVVVEKHLCSKCAMASMQSKLHPKRCEYCGFSYNDIVQSGKCGCSKCYDVFFDALLPYLKKLHGSTEHRGKTPTAKSKSQNDIDSLHMLLNRLIAEERYEDAAVVRDKIKALEEKAL